MEEDERPKRASGRERSRPSKAAFTPPEVEEAARPKQPAARRPAPSVLFQPPSAPEEPAPQPRRAPGPPRAATPSPTPEPDSTAQPKPTANPDPTARPRRAVAPERPPRPKPTAEPEPAGEPEPTAESSPEPSENRAAGASATRAENSTPQAQTPARAAAPAEGVAPQATTPAKKTAKKAAKQAPAKVAKQAAPKAVKKAAAKAAKEIPAKAVKQTPAKAAPKESAMPAAAAPVRKTAAKKTAAKKATAAQEAAAPATVMAAPAKKVAKKATAKAASLVTGAVVRRTGEGAGPVTMPRLLDQPGFAPEIMAVAAVRVLGPQARAWAARTVAAYPAATPDGLARLATRRYVRWAGAGGVVSAAFGVFGPVGEFGAVAWAQTALVLHVAAAYGHDPADPERAVDLLVLMRVHPGVETARAALAGAAEAATETQPVLRAVEAAGRLAAALSAETRGWQALRLVTRVLPGARLLVAGAGGGAAVERLAHRAVAHYRTSS